MRHLSYRPVYPVQNGKISKTEETERDGTTLVERALHHLFAEHYHRSSLDPGCGHLPRLGQVCVHSRVGDRNTSGHGQTRSRHRSRPAETALWASSDFKNSLKSRGIRVVAVQNLTSQFQRRKTLFHSPRLPVFLGIRRRFRGDDRDCSAIHADFVDQRHGLMLTEVRKRSSALGRANKSTSRARGGPRTYSL